MLLRIIYFGIALSITSCLFSNDKGGKLVKISPSFTFHIYASGNDLLYKKDKRMNVSEVVERNIDSIGWNKNYIIIFSKGAYKSFSLLKSPPEAKSFTLRDMVSKIDILRDIELNSAEYYKNEN